MSSVRKRGNKCYTRTNKAGVPYTVCNDPPRGSRGQAGVYQAANPTGKQDGRTARNEAKNDKEIALRKVRRAMMNKDYQEFAVSSGFGELDDPLNPYDFNLKTVDGEKLKFPKRRRMMLDLINKKIPKEQFIKMPTRYIKIRWLRETKAGKKFRKDNEMKKPKAYAEVDDKTDQAAFAEDIFVAALEGRKTEATTYTNDAIGEVVPKDTAVNKTNYDRFEGGKMSASQAEIFQENALRYKHYLEIAGKDVPDWVKDASA